MSEDKDQHKIPDESLIVKYLSGKTNPEEKYRIEQWIQESADNEKSFAVLKKIYHHQKIRQRMLTYDSGAAFRTVMQRSKKKRQAVILRRVSVAASIIAILFGLGLFFNDKIQIGEPSLVMVTAPENAHTKLDLPDGTEVFLNRGSSISYPATFSEHQRNVILDGEAFFKVAHNPDQPFVVSNKDEQYHIKVLGTEFNVQAHAGQDVIQTTLVSGRIELSIEDIGTKDILSPSQRATYSLETKQLQIAEVNTDRDLDWLYNRLVFRNTPMNEVLDQLAKFYNIKFDVQSKLIETYKFTGTFEDKPLSQVLDYLKISSKLQYRIVQPNKDSEVTTVQLYK